MPLPDAPAAAPLRKHDTAHSMADLVALGVRQARAELGWTQTELAVAAAANGTKVSTRTVSWIESGKRNLRLSSVEAVARALGTTGTGLLLEGEALARGSKR